MSALELLREEVKQELDNADLEVLEKVRELLNGRQSSAEDLWDELPEHVKEDVQIARAQAVAGLGISHEKFRQKHAAWFTK